MVLCVSVGRTIVFSDLTATFCSLFSDLFTPFDPNNRSSVLILDSYPFNPHDFALVRIILTRNEKRRGGQRRQFVKRDNLSVVFVLRTHWHSHLPAARWSFSVLLLFTPCSPAVLLPPPCSSRCSSRCFTCSFSVSLDVLSVSPDVLLVVLLFHLMFSLFCCSPSFLLLFFSLVFPLLHRLFSLFFCCSLSVLLLFHLSIELMEVKEGWGRGRKRGEEGVD